MLIINSIPISINNDDDHYAALVERQEKADNNDTLRDDNSTQIGSTSVRIWRTVDPRNFPRKR